MTNKIDVIFIKDCKHWKKNELKSVSPLFFRQVLSAQWLAKIADSKTINEVKQKEESIKKHHEEDLKKLRDMIESIKSNGWVKVLRQATAMHHLYDKVDEKDIAREILMTYKVKLPEKALKLEHKIENLGEYIVKFDYEWIKDKFPVVVEKK